MDGLSSDTDKFPPGPALFFNCIIDFFFHLLNFPQWRKYVPFGLADENSNRWLSYVVPTTENYPKLLSYSEFLSKTESNISVGSFYSYAFLTPSTKLGCINNRGSLLVLIILIVILRRIKSILLPKFCSIGRSVGNSSFNQNFEQRQKKSRTYNKI